MITAIGKAIWRAIRYLQKDNRFYDEEFEFFSGKEWWEFINGKRMKKYSYKWVLEWISNHSDGDVWTDLFQKDPYLKRLCEINKIIMFDQLLYYGNEWAKR